jgi:hypothetical protein
LQGWRIKVTPMKAAIEFAGLGLVILGSISFALLLEWLSLWGLMKLMPATKVGPRLRRVAPLFTGRLRLRAVGRWGKAAAMLLIKVLVVLSGLGLLAMVALVGYDIYVALELERLNRRAEVVPTERRSRARNRNGRSPRPWQFLAGPRRRSGSVRM